jgi:hypothetical protein
MIKPLYNSRGFLLPRELIILEELENFLSGKSKNSVKPLADTSARQKTE